MPVFMKAPITTRSNVTLRRAGKQYPAKHAHARIRVTGTAAYLNPPAAPTLLDICANRPDSVAIALHNQTPDGPLKAVQACIAEVFAAPSQRHLPSSCGESSKVKATAPQPC
jgi:hypothetical protein